MQKVINISFRVRRSVITGKGGVIEWKGHKFQRCLLDDPEGIDIDKFLGALKTVGYNGWLTIIEPISELMDNIEMAKMYYREFWKRQKEDS